MSKPKTKTKPYAKTYGPQPYAETYDPSRTPKRTTLAAHRNVRPQPHT